MLGLKRKFKVFLQRYGLALPEKHTMGFSGTLKIGVKREGERFFTDYGVVSREKVQDVFAEHIVDALQVGTTLNIFIWHAFGESTADESSTDEFLMAETTQSRIAGTSTESSSMVWQSVATKTFEAACTVGEHGIFNSSGLSTGVMMDRSVFDGVPMSSGDQMQFTYTLTVVSSG